MIQGLIRSLKRFVSRMKQHLKQWSKPAFPSGSFVSLIAITSKRGSPHLWQWSTLS